MHGSKAGTRWHSENIIAIAASTQKELIIVENANHFDLYNIPEYVNQAINKLVPFFQKFL